jgi:hypothetical protein
MISGIGKLRKVYFLTALLAAFTLFPAVTFAQDLPCGGDDPYGNCPLDTNVWILAGIALLAGVWFIFKQQKPRRTKAS